MRSAKPPTRFWRAACSSASVGPSRTKPASVARTTWSASSVCAFWVCSPTTNGPGCASGEKYEYTLYDRPRFSRTSAVSRDTKPPPPST